MTKALSFTQASLRRAIAAAKAAGLRVTGIRPDGTLLVNDGDNAAALVPADGTGAHDDATSDHWGDLEV